MADETTDPPEPVPTVPTAPPPERDNSFENNVRECAAKLLEAVREARANGYEVTWPSRADDLESIAVSEVGET
jgi:hypothetical protein